MVLKSRAGKRKADELCGRMISHKVGNYTKTQDLFRSRLGAECLLFYPLLGISDAGGGGSQFKIRTQIQRRGISLYLGIQHSA